MTSADVFVPSNGELIIRDNLANGLTTANDMFYRKSRDGRPETMGGYRFGQLSHSSFFTRHNPHPRRVNHMKGLLDVPICSVNDKGFFANAKYNLQFPPNSYNHTVLSQRLPVNAINVNSQLHPINTITGLQNFTGLQSGPFREKVAHGGMGAEPSSEAWRDELKALTKAAGLEMDAPPSGDKLPEISRSPKKTVYSATTGRLIPPPSRMSMGRAASKDSQRKRLTASAMATGPNLDLTTGDNPDEEAKVLQMLCQILQTDDINAVKSWLVSAGMKEKNVVLDMIRIAIEAKDNYYQRQYPVGGVEEYLTDMEVNEAGEATIGGDGVQNRISTGEGKPTEGILPPLAGVAKEDGGAEIMKLDRSDVKRMLMPRTVSREANKWATLAPNHYDPVKLNADQPSMSPVNNGNIQDAVGGSQEESTVHHHTTTPNKETHLNKLPKTPRAHKLSSPSGPAN